MRKIGDILETIVVVAILLVLVHTFLDDCSIIAGWAVASRKWIVWTGLAFDLFFTIEFFTRLYIALVNGEGAEYFLRQRGWIDFLASIPLLLLNSLPSAVALLAGAGLVSGAGSFLNVLKVIKAVRIARILRLLRVIKLFRSIRYAQSPMAQRHLSTIITVGVTILVFWSFGSAALERLGILPGLETTYLQGQTLRARSITEGGPKGAALSERAAAVAALDSTVLDDAVATQDTVTQLVAAIRRVAREVPGAAEVLPGASWSPGPGGSDNWRPRRTAASAPLFSA